MHKLSLHSYGTVLTVFGIMPSLVSFSSANSDQHRSALRPNGLSSVLPIEPSHFPLSRSDTHVFIG